MSLTGTEDWRRWSVVGVGVLLGVFAVGGGLADYDSLLDFGLETFLPLVVSLLLVAFGTRLARSDLGSTYFPRLLAWMSIGAAAFVLLESWLIVHRVLIEGLLLREGFHDVVTSASAGALVGVVIGMYDVRRQQHAEELELADRIVESTMDGIAVLDADDRYVSANPSYADMYGYDTAAEMVGERWRYLTSEENRERFETEIEPTLAETGTWRGEVSVRRADGSAFVGELTVTELEDGRRVCVIRDVTERKERNRELRTRVTAMDASMDGMAILDEGGTYTYVNEAHAEVYGYDDPEAFIGEQWQTCYTDEEVARFEEEVMPTLWEDGQWRGAATGRRRDGSLFPQELTITVLENGGLVCVVRDVTERKEQQRALERSEDLLEKTQRIADVGGWEYDPVGDEVQWTDGVYRIFGLPSDTELELDDVVDYVHPDDVSGLREAIERAVDHGESYEYEYRAVTPDGTLRWVHTRGELREEHGEEVLRGTVQDVTERKAYEQELRSTKETLSTLLENIPAGVLAENGSREVLFANQALCRLFGIPASPDELIGRDCAVAAENVTERLADPERFIEGNERSVAAGETVRGEEFELVDGRTIERSGTPIPVDDGDDRYLWVYHDVTRRKRTERTLRVLHEATREMLTAETRAEVADVASETATDILGFSLNAVYRYEADTGLVPVTASSAVGDAIGESPVIPPGEGIAWQAFETGEPQVHGDVREASEVLNPGTAVRTEICLPLGGYGVLMLASRTVNDYDEADVALAKVLAANAEAALDRVEREVRLRAQQEDLARQNTRLEEFASVVSHDLRNPLTIAMGYLELVESDDEESVEKIQDALDRMEQIIGDVLTLARQGKSVGETRPVSIAEAAETAWGHVETGDARLVLEDDVRTVSADRSRLETLFENLFRNAIEHGREDVTCRIGSTAEGFYVEDDGPGIPADQRDLVFEHGHSTSDTGTGFGLSIVRTIAEAHGWSVTVTEADGGGARFEVRCYRPSEPVLHAPHG